MPGPRRAGLAAKPGGQVERAAPVPALHGDGLARVQADADGEGEGGVGDRLVGEAGLEIRRGSKGLAGRSEYGQGLVASELDEGPAPCLDSLPGDLGEPGRELGGRLVPALLREEGVAANVGDQEGPDLGRGVRLIHEGSMEAPGGGTPGWTEAGGHLPTRSSSGWARR